MAAGGAWPPGSRRGRAALHAVARGYGAPDNARNPRGAKRRGGGRRATRARARRVTHDASPSTGISPNDPSPRGTRIASWRCRTTAPMTPRRRRASRGCGAWPPPTGGSGSRDRIPDTGASGARGLARRPSWVASRRTLDGAQRHLDQAPLVRKREEHRIPEAVSVQPSKVSDEQEPAVALELGREEHGAAARAADRFRVTAIHRRVGPVRSRFVHGAG